MMQPCPGALPAVHPSFSAFKTAPAATIVGRGRRMRKLPLCPPSLTPPSCTCTQVFQNFVPHIVGMGADMAAMMEKCAVVDERASYSGRPIKGMPNVSEKEVPTSWFEST